MRFSIFKFATAAYNLVRIRSHGLLSRGGKSLEEGCDVLVECHQARIVSSKSLLSKVEIEIERLQGLIVNIGVHAEETSRSGIERALQTAGGETTLQRPASAALLAESAEGLTRGKRGPAPKSNSKAFCMNRAMKKTLNCLFGVMLPNA